MWADPGGQYGLSQGFWLSRAGGGEPLEASGREVM